MNEEDSALFDNPNWRRVCDMWSRIDGPYQRVSMGVGDAINLSGAAVHLANRDGPVTWHTYRFAEKTVRSIFALHPEVSVVRIDDWAINPFANTVSPHTLLLNQETVAPRYSPLEMFEHIHVSHGIAYDTRWSSCPVAKAASLVPQEPVPKKPYCFVHDSAHHGHLINQWFLPGGLSRYRPDPNRDISILSYVDVIQSASEIHVIDSAFFHLVECLETNAVLVFHRYSRMSAYVKKWNDYRTKHSWEILSG